MSAQELSAFLLLCKFCFDVCLTVNCITSGRITLEKNTVQHKIKANYGSFLIDQFLKFLRFYLFRSVKLSCYVCILLHVMQSFASPLCKFS